jgi:hypothetical protein
VVTGVVTGVGVGGVVAFTSGDADGAVVGAVVAGGVVVVFVPPIGTVTAGMANPANDVLDKADGGEVADA